jgi:hypothetical protein
LVSVESGGSMIEVIKQLVEALEHELCIDWTNDEEFNASAEKMHDAIQAGRQAIAELESQEPVACGTYQEVTDTMNALWAGTLEQVQIAEEMKNKKLYAHPPQRPWVGLTDMERQMTINKHEGVAWETAIAIEQQLKEKNV